MSIILSIEKVFVWKIQCIYYTGDRKQSFAVEEIEPSPVFFPECPISGLIPEAKSHSHANDAQPSVVMSSPVHSGRKLISRKC